MKKALFVVCCLLLTTLQAQTHQTDNITNSIGVKFVKIKAGCFMMGRDSSLKYVGNDELPRHQVCIQSPFYLSQTEITQTQWTAIMRYNPSDFKAPDKPVEQVTWDNIQKFLHKLNENEQEKDNHHHYRLPTEAEWEYAANAGSTSAYHFGDNPEDLPQYAWFGYQAADKQTHIVGQKQPNPWGLYDMYGNVWEWTQDWYDKDYYSKNHKNDPQGPDSGEYRVVRGGGWNSSASNLRSAHRHFNLDSEAHNYLGFRLLLIKETK